MDDLDLDINNYDIDELLNLFNLERDFNEKQLKGARAIVLKLHPDKSKLDSKYFLFYSKAYKTVCNMWMFRMKTERKFTEEETVYISDTGDIDVEERKTLLKRMFAENQDLKKAENFNKWFNKEFEKAKLHDDTEDGYEEWLRSNDDTDTNQDGRMTMGQMKHAFAEKKRQLCSDVVLHKDIEGYQNGSFSGLGSNIISEKGSFDSNTFSERSGSGIGFQDLRKAHTETIIPVDEQLLENRPHITSVTQMNEYRQSQNLYVPAGEHERIHAMNMKSENEAATNRAFRLEQQTREVEDKTNGFWKNIKLLYDK
jgi:hypothetical protein